MKLFIKPGSCSLASHIALREVGAAFDIDLVDFEAGKSKSGVDYNTINPKGYVPALQLDNGEVLTEGASVLQYIADQHPANNLAPASGTILRARLQEYLNYTSSELHKAFGPLFATGTSDAHKEKTKTNVAKKLDYVNTLLKDNRAMQLTPAPTRYSIFSHGALSCKYDRSYGYVSHRRVMSGISVPDTLARWISLSEVW